MSKLKYWDGSQWKQIAPSKEEFDNQIEILSTNLGEQTLELQHHKSEYLIQTATGTANVITIITNGDFQYTQGNKLSFRAVVNSTGNVTINIDGKGAKALRKLDGTQIGANGIKNGKVYEVFYNTDNDSFFLLARAEGDAIAENVLAGKIFSNDDDTGITGTMPNRTGHIAGQSTSLNGTTLRIRPQEGYYDGTSGNSVQFTDANFLASNIRNGTDLFGLTGSLIEGSSFKTAPRVYRSSAGNSTIPSVDMSKTILLTGSPQLIPNLTSSTNINFNTVGTVYALEFNNNVLVQRGTGSSSSTSNATINIAISSVNVSRSVVVVYCSSSGSWTLSAVDYQLTSSTNLRIVMPFHEIANTTTYGWQVLTFL